MNSLATPPCQMLAMPRAPQHHVPDRGGSGICRELGQRCQSDPGGGELAQRRQQALHFPELQDDEDQGDQREAAGQPGDDPAHWAMRGLGCAAHLQFLVETDSSFVADPSSDSSRFLPGRRRLRLWQSSIRPRPAKGRIAGGQGNRFYLNAPR